MAARSPEAPPSEWKSQWLIGKVSVSLQLPLEVAVAIETISALRCAFRTAHVHRAWKIHFYNAIWAKETTFITQLSDFIGDWDVSVSFWRIWCLLGGCPRGVSKMAAEWHDLSHWPQTFEPVSAGRYNKFSRELPQTPWVIDGERRMDGSVEELIAAPLLSSFRAHGKIGTPNCRRHVIF